MSLVLFIAIASLGCAFMLFILVRWVQDRTGRTIARNAASAANPTQPFLVKSGDGDQASNVKGARPTRSSGGLRSSRWSARRSGRNDSERFVHQRIARALV